MAEVILRHQAGDRFEAFSGGTHPAGFVHPLAIEALTRLSIPIEGLESKGLDEFCETHLDVVITVCEVAARETCPVWRGVPLCVNWPLSDPATHPGSDKERIALALRVAERLRMKIEALAKLDWAMPRDDLVGHLLFLGEI